MQAQRDVGILGRVASGRVEIDLIERDLLRAFADDVLVLDGGDAKVQGGDGVHVVARGRRVQHVGLEHRVVLDSAELHAVVLEDVRVVLQVMAELRCRALEPGFQPREHALAVQLVRGTGVPVGERDVSGLAGSDRKRDADELGFHVDQAGRFGVERDQRRFRHALTPAFERGFGQDGLVVRRPSPSPLALVPTR